MAAVYANNYDLAELLIKYGARAGTDSDGNVVHNNNGDTYLTTAVKNGNYEMVKLLMDNGADPTLLDNDGKGPLDHAIHMLDPKMVLALIHPHYDEVEGDDPAIMVTDKHLEDAIDNIHNVVTPQDELDWRYIIGTLALQDTDDNKKLDIKNHLINAVDKGVIFELLENGGELSVENNDGGWDDISVYVNGTGTFRTPLMYAIEKKPDIVDEAMINYTNPNTRDDDTGKTALFYAQDKPRIIKLLLKAKAKANPNIQDYYGNTVLHITNNTDVIKLLLEAGANPNIQNDDGNTVLHITNNPEVIKLLLEAKADPNIKNKDGNTVLHITNNPEVIELLLKAGAEAYIENKKGEMAVDNNIVEETIAELFKPGGDIFKAAKESYYNPNPENPDKMDIE
jgi:ankyrin repeat protein